MCVNKIETMYGRSDVNVKVERGSTFTFTRGFSYIVSILYTHVKPVKVYVRTNQWSVPAILLFTKNADYENEKCLKIKIFIRIAATNPP